MRIGVLSFLIALSEPVSLALAQDSGSTVKPVNTTQQSPLKSEANTLFKRIYEHPDDLDALFRYAQVTTELGDYEAAIGALERILYFRHDLPRVQLELGALYFRLHSFPMARSYFDTVLKGKDVPEPVRRRVTAYLAAIATAEQQSKTFSAFFQTGARYQTNANAGPNGLVVRALGNDAILSSAFARKPDWNWFGQGGFRWLQPIDDGRGDAWETQGFGYYSAQQRFSQYDLGFAEIATGPRIALGTSGSWVRPYGLLNTSSLGSNPYMSSAGAGLTVGYEFAPWLIFEPNVEMRWRDYSNSPDYPFATEQDGRLGTVTGLVRGRIQGVWGWQALASWARNDTGALFDYFAFDQVTLGAGLSRDFAVPVAGREQIWTVWLHGGWGRTAYDAPNPIVDPDVFRVDREWRAALTLEAPLNAWADLGASISYAKVNSTLPNYDTTNWSFTFGPYARF
jgi:hypothetical protein